MFVCTGNICRSPIAERLASAFCAKRDVPDFRCSSAGTRAVIGHPIHDEAALVLRRLGGDSSDFGARQLTQRIAADADLVITMTKAHRGTVLELAPRLLHRTFTLSEASLLTSEYHARTVDDLAALRPQLAGRNLEDVKDPINQGRDVFTSVGSQIAALLEPVVSLFGPST